HPLDSWSKYRSIVDPAKLVLAKDFLRRGNEVNQMMKVVGEEGTSIDDFVCYLKSEFLDYVYLQQNTFDKVDGATDLERQRYVFDKVTTVLNGSFDFTDKEQAHSYFLNLRQQFIDWNYLAMASAEFKAKEQEINAKLKEHMKNA
ncbi:MAG: hypothetical protein RR060_05020, partial [Victivallaceae bacterium]